MHKNLWQQAEQIVETMNQLPVNEQAGFITTQTANQVELKALVEKMVLAQSDDSFMRILPSVELKEMMAASADQKFGHFTIVRKIAVGGMGRIFKAQISQSEVPVFVALKLIRKELINAHMNQRFDNEKQILSKLKHHHIAALIDAGMVGENPYIATEWVDGQAINQYVESHDLGVDKILNLFVQVCEAVSYAHNQLVIHRDLKPANILIDKNDQVKLLDFGIAKLIDADNNQMTQTQVFTPDYAAPEQINGQVCTAVTDIYALGVLLFELLVGKKRFGFESLSVAEKIEAISQPKTVFASQVMQRDSQPGVQKVKGALDTIINQAMHPDPERRYQSVYELISDIKRYQNHRPIKALGDSWLYRSQMFIRRNAWSSVLTSLLLISLVSGLVYSNHQKEQAQLAEQTAQIEAEKSQQMLNFFMTMMERASPINGGSTQITVQKMFEEGGEKFNIEAINDPALRADIARQIGQFYGELGVNDLKVKYNQVATNFFASNLDQYATEYLRMQLSTAVAYREQEKYDLALQLLNDVRKKVKNHSPDDEAVALLLIQLAEVHRNFGQDDKALEFLSQAEILATEHNALESMGKVKYYQHMILQYRISPAQSEVYLSEAQDLFEQAFDGQTHPSLLVVRNSLGMNYKNQGKYQQAIELYEVIHKEHEKQIGRSDFDSLTNHADAAYYIGQFSKTIKLTNESLDIIDTYDYGKGFSYMAASIIQARAYLELKQYGQTRDMLQTAMNYFSEKFEDNHITMWVLRSYWLDYLVKSGRESEYQGDVAALLKLAYNELNESNGSKRKLVNTLVIVATYHWHVGEYRAALSEMEAAQKTVNEISLKQEWSYWLIEAGVQQLRYLLDFEYDSHLLNTAKQELFMLLPADHWYHNLFDSS